MADEPASKQPIGVIGLGLLGTALAERLLGAGYPIRIFNRTRTKAGPLIERGAIWSENPLAECERTVICLYTTEIVEQVLRQLDSGLHSGQILIDTTTGDPNQTAALGKQLAERGVAYLEAPVAASSSQTRQGQALIIVGGSRDAFERCDDLLAVLAAKYFHVGPWGCAAKTKLVNNLVLGLNRVALAEGLVFAKSIGLEPTQLLAVLKQGSAYSVVMDVKGQKMVDADFTAQAKLAQHAKDVRLILQQAAQRGLQLPLSSLHLQLLDRAEAAGFGELDNSAIIRIFEGP